MKKIIKILLTLLLVLPLNACHGSKALPTFVVPEEFDTTKTYELTFWAKNDSNSVQVNTYKKAIEEFEKLYPNIKINMTLYTDYTRIYNDVITNISTQTTPNICITYPDHIATYLTGKNIVAPLTELINDVKYGLGGSQLKFDSVSKEEVVSAFLEEGNFSGEYYALPFMRSSEACYINKTFVEKLGYTLPEVLTWDFVWEVSEAAMAKNEDGTFKINGQTVMIPFIYKSTDNMMIQMLQQLNAPYSKEDGTIEIFNNVTKDILREINLHSKSGAFSTFKLVSYPGNFLNAGQCIFAIDSTAGATWMGSDAPLMDIPDNVVVDFETVVMEIPQYDVENPQMISQGPSICVFNKEDSQEVLASWLFAQYLLTNETQISYASTEGYIPVTTKAQNSSEYQEYLSLRGIDNNEHYSVKIDATILVLNNINNTFTTYVFNGSASLRQAAGYLIEAVCKANYRKETVNDEYLEKIFSETNSLYRLDQTSSSSITQQDLGGLPNGSKALLISLGSVWIILGVYAFATRKKVRFM